MKGGMPVVLTGIPPFSITKQHAAMGMPGESVMGVSVRLDGFHLWEVHE